MAKFDLTLMVKVLFPSKNYYSQVLILAGSSCLIPDNSGLLVFISLTRTHSQTQYKPIINFTACQLCWKKVITEVVLDFCHFLLLPQLILDSLVTFSSIFNIFCDFVW